MELHAEKVAADGVFVDKIFNRGQIERFAYVCRDIDKVEFRAVNVDFAGEINTGGIAGMNYGTLRACRAEGSVTGDNRTGGIAGYNFGRIASCRSDASVNTESVDPTINPKNLRLNFNLDFSQTANLDAADAASDTGGIAGYSIVP